MNARMFQIMGSAVLFGSGVQPGVSPDGSCRLPMESRQYGERVYRSGFSVAGNPAAGRGCGGMGSDATVCVRGQRNLAESPRWR